MVQNHSRSVITVAKDMSLLPDYKDEPHVLLWRPMGETDGLNLLPYSQGTEYDVQNLDDRLQSSTKPPRPYHPSLQPGTWKIPLEPSFAQHGSLHYLPPHRPRKRFNPTTSFCFADLLRMLGPNGETLPYPQQQVPPPSLNPLTRSHWRP